MADREKEYEAGFRDGFDVRQSSVIIASLDWPILCSQNDPLTETEAIVKDTFDPRGDSV